MHPEGKNRKRKQCIVYERKAIMNRPRLKKKYEDWPSRENFKNWKKRER